VVSTSNAVKTASATAGNGADPEGPPLRTLPLLAFELFRGGFPEQQLAYVLVSYLAVGPEELGELLIRFREAALERFQIGENPLEILE
jgi:hypothetical protein